MDGDKTIGTIALRRIGEALRRRYYVPWMLPSRLYSLVKQLGRITKEDDYLDNAADAVRLAQHTSILPDKARLLELGEAWVSLAEKAHETARRQQPPATLHPLVRKKLGTPTAGANQAWLESATLACLDG
jgi:hypothetical protein